MEFNAERQRLAGLTADFRFSLEDYSREDALRLFKQYWELHTPEVQAKLLGELRAHNLACACPLDQPCLGDILLDLLGD